MPADDMDMDRLSAHLKALAHPVRLELLHILRYPTAPGDIAVRPRRHDALLEPERAMSRPALLDHLEKMEKAGIVARVEGSGAARYVTSAQHVFAAVEDLRSLAALEPGARMDVDETLGKATAEAPAWPRGPRLVLLGGPWEGRAFALAGDGPWTLGRSRTRGVALTYDPFASAEHAHIEHSASGLAVVSSERARNPALLNLAPLSPGLPRALRPGDIVTVGRSHLVFQP